MLFEKGKKAGFSVKSALQGNLADGKLLLVKKQIFGMVQSAQLHKAIYGYARKALEISIKLGAANSKALCQFIRINERIKALRDHLQDVPNLRGSIAKANGIGLRTEAE